MIDPFPLREGIDKKITQLFEFNQNIAKDCRRKAKDFERIAAHHFLAGQLAYDIAADIAELAMVAATNTGDIIVAQFALGNDDDEESETEQGDEVDEEDSEDGM